METFFFKAIEKKHEFCRSYFSCIINIFYIHLHSFMHNQEQIKLNAL